MHEGPPDVCGREAAAPTRCAVPCVCAVCAPAPRPSPDARGPLPRVGVSGSAVSCLGSGTCGRKTTSLGLCSCSAGCILSAAVWSPPRVPSWVLGDVSLRYKRTNPCKKKMWACLTRPYEVCTQYMFYVKKRNTNSVTTHTRLQRDTIADRARAPRG